MSTIRIEENGRTIVFEGKNAAQDAREFMAMYGSKATKSAESPNRVATSEGKARQSGTQSKSWGVARWQYLMTDGKDVDRPKAGATARRKEISKWSVVDKTAVYAAYDEFLQACIEKEAIKAKDIEQAIPEVNGLFDARPDKYLELLKRVKIEPPRR
jgi:hypothetical protein